LLAGALPFTAADPIELIHCHIAREPVAAVELASTVPAALSMIIMKLLAKTAEERYQTAAGVEADLRNCLTAWESNGRIALFPPGLEDASELSIAVLPFQKMSGDPEQERFADGLAEDIITELSRFREFAVIARNSTFLQRRAARRGAGSPGPPGAQRA
jgi:serine/threonine protein kinase